jgi:hypothetical protein
MEPIKKDAPNELSTINKNNKPPAGRPNPNISLPLSGTVISSIYQEKT